MKTLPNQIFSIEIPGIKSPVTTASLLKLCLANPPQGGFDYKEMRARNKIEDAVETVEPGGTIELEDADHAVAVQCVTAMRWGIRHKDLAKFGELFGC
jgi:hypothetical protein